MTVYGGVRIDRQTRKLKTGVDVVIATPGRLLDHMNRRNIDLSHVEVFVLDEADRMFDMGFIDDVRDIVSAIPRKRQTLLFSATISARVKRLAESIQTDPVLIEIGEQQNPIESVTQHVYPTQTDKKIELLKTILDKEKMDMVLVFTATKVGADFVVRRLQHYGISAMQIHSNLRQRERQQSMDGFKDGKYRVLVATDIAARGIDIEGISHVVNYDVPRYAEDYIHRIGRTGRADATGDAITLVGYEEEEFLSKIEEFIGKKFERKSYPGFDHGVVKLQKPAATSVSRRGRRRGRRKYV
jgi:ATP-dependent RNA helicase RhlE